MSEKSNAQSQEQDRVKDKTGTDESVTIPKVEYDQWIQKAQESEERLLRMAAEFENTKKRLEKRSQELVKFSNEKIIMDILPVIDDLDRAIASVDQGHDTKAVQQGLHMVQKTFHNILEQNGVSMIDCKGQNFDANLHEAIGEVKDSAKEEGSIVEVVQSGYLLNGRLVRPSKVRISVKE